MFLNILSAEASALVDRLAIENQVKVVLFRQPDGDAVSREEVEPSHWGESLMTAMPFYLRPLAQSAISYAERGLGYPNEHQEGGAAPSVEQEHLFVQLSALSLDEIEAFLNIEARSRGEGIIIDKDFIHTFAELFMKQLPSPSLEDLKKQFSVFCSQYGENGASYTVDNVYEFFGQILGKDVEDVKDSLKPKWTARIANMGHLFEEYIVRPWRWIIHYVSSRIWAR